MALAFWVVAYGFVGLGLAIAILMDEERCPKNASELFLIWVFWLPLVVGFFISKLFISILPQVAPTPPQKYVKKVRGA